MLFLSPSLPQQNLLSVLTGNEHLCRAVISAAHTRHSSTLWPFPSSAQTLHARGALLLHRKTTLHHR